MDNRQPRKELEKYQELPYIKRKKRQSNVREIRCPGVELGPSSIKTITKSFSDASYKMDGFKSVEIRGSEHVGYN